MSTLQALVAWFQSLVRFLKYFKHGSVKFQKKYKFKKGRRNKQKKRGGQPKVMSGTKGMPVADIEDHPGSTPMEARTAFSTRLGIADLTRPKRETS